MEAAEQIGFKVGRYEIAGHLAAGGMAEILLGRLVGPNGFERPVAIKRILPHLARDGEFVRMFADEARIAARIQHPNVVNVHELLEENGMPYMVMEYLEGESLGSVMRRLASKGRKMPMSLAAHIIAEAAAGLHAAHELVDDKGELMEIVHRDVSPQNILVTYSGAVKVLDFGIARALDRTGPRTQTGQLKGKFSYMSPEQCLALDMDRRSDLFSLGVVLFEITTLRRLFKRRNEVQTLKAIAEDPIPKPGRDYPKLLQTVLDKSLARDLSQRFQTGKEMRHHLVLAQRALDNSTTMPDSELSSLMKELFPERIERKNEMLAHLREGQDLSVPIAEVDLEIEMPADFTGPSSTQLRSIENKSRIKRWWWAFVALLALISALTVFYLIKPSEPKPVVVSQPKEPIAPPPPATVEKDTLAARATRLPTTIDVMIQSNPRGAEVIWEKKVAGRTPLTLKIPYSEEQRELTLALDGYESRTLSFVPNANQRNNLDLRRKRTGHSGMRRRTMRATMATAPVTMAEPPPPAKMDPPQAKMRWTKIQ